MMRKSMTQGPETFFYVLLNVQAFNFNACLKLYCFKIVFIPLKGQCTSNKGHISNIEKTIIDNYLKS